LRITFKPLTMRGRNSLRSRTPTLKESANNPFLYGVAMSYIFVIPILLTLAGLMYFYISRKPELEPIVGEDHDPVKIHAAAPEQTAFTEWESVLIRALDHIYSGASSSTGNQMTHVYEPPSELARTAIASLVKAFDKVGTLHSSLAAIDNPDVSMKELGDLVTRDPLLSARVLKTVNSPFFRVATDVKSIHTAVNILGLTNLKNLIAFGVMPYALYKNPEHQRMFKTIWQHMNSTAITAAHMARARQDLDSGTLYTAGLMHDIGKLVLILLVKEPEEGELYPLNLDREYERLMATHLQAAQIMAQSGSIPQQLRTLVLSHHLPALLPVSQLDCDAQQAKSLTVLFLANQIAKLISPHGTLLDDVRRLDQLDPSYREVISRQEAREILLSRGLIDDIIANVRVVQAALN
jgi:HD-like signal output (HDOD) protein